ncbi:MAG TPA: flagellar hook-length control protein FliK [Rhodanobacteraceae bacterium]|nr:flagellar hook-length control protein FliK [Rhodanobacteraceae bacterium]
MNNLAIPATPSPGAPKPEVANPVAPAGQHFDDTLRQARPAPQPPNAGPTADDNAGTPAHKGTKAAAGKQSDRHSRDDTGSSSSPSRVATIAPTPAPQSPAGHDKASPAGNSQTSDATTHSMDAKNIALAAVATTQASPPGGPASAQVLPAQPVQLPAPTVSVNDIAGVAPAPTAQPDSTTATNAAVGASTYMAPSHASLQTVLQAAAQSAGAQSDADSKDSGTTPDANAFIAHLAQLAAATSTPPAASQPAPVQLTMQSTPGQPQFVQEAAQHVAWLAGQDVQRAEIQLNPRELGPIQVEITTHHDRVDVSFAVQHPQTVHALQQTLPQLTDMLAQQGLNLGQASVGQQAPGQQQPAFSQQPGSGIAGGNIDSDESEPRSTWRTLRLPAPGRVDDFA